MHWIFRIFRLAARDLYELIMGVGQSKNSHCVMVQRGCDFSALHSRYAWEKSNSNHPSLIGACKKWSLEQQFCVVIIIISFLSFFCTTAPKCLMMNNLTCLVTWLTFEKLLKTAILSTFISWPFIEAPQSRLDPEKYREKKLLGQLWIDQFWISYVSFFCTICEYLQKIREVQ